ncbi:MAG: hypothetical protein HC782_05210 [Gammaproteobacteria bacterium]|nr:hypothetical protein [Gammaproteobacteria bacterium]
MNIITRGPKPQERSAQIAATAGSYDTLGASAGINLATERFGLGLNAARLSSDNYRRNNALTQENVAGEVGGARHYTPLWPWAVGLCLALKHA